ncbi:MAG: metallophosphatase [Flavobacteriaceae bacterium]|nr:metallophosphatase [Flavobacteriaceae bacterium]|tara:strand:+ start:9665 stop:10570 length:906 start_codon:yes stop_codon:yes gene_type:complete
MKRRTFVKNTAASATFVSIGGLQLSCKKINSTKITILHTNDVHSHIEPFGKNSGENANKGGVARRATIIDKLRRENANTLLLDAGDIFQGTPYFNYFGGELEFKLMSMLKYDAATIGNHDFDNGIEGLYNMLPHAKFDFLSANYDFKNTIMNTHVKPYKIFNKSGIKIGVFGLGVELKGLVDTKAYKETNYMDPIEISQDMSRILKIEKGCDLVICLSHLGYDYKNSSKVSDLKLARSTKNIDLIIGGHTHTFLNKPTQEINVEGKTVLVNQVGCFGLYLGRIDFYLESQNKFYKSEIITV